MKITDVPVADPQSGIDYRSYKIQFQAPQNVGLLTWRIYIVSDSFVGEEVSRDIVVRSVFFFRFLLLSFAEREVLDEDRRLVCIDC